ncbi:unnamed protein product [Sphagnum tenellum]
MTCKHVPSAKKIISELLHSTKVRYSHWSNCLQGSSSSIGAILVGAVLFRIRTRSVYNFNLRTEPSSMTGTTLHPAAGDRWFDQDKNTTVAWWPLMILSGCNSDVMDISNIICTFIVLLGTTRMLTVVPDIVRRSQAKWGCWGDDQRSGGAQGCGASHGSAAATAAVADTAQSAKETTKEKADQTADSTKKKVGGTTDAAAQTIGDTWESTRETASETASSAQEKAREVTDSAVSIGVLQRIDLLMQLEQHKRKQPGLQMLLRTKVGITRELQT